MKKITLALLTACGMVGSVLAQPNIVVTAPPYNTTTQFRLPNGTFEQKTMRGVCLILKSELAALTGSIVNNVLVTRFDGTDPVPASGNFTLWLQNTSDVSYTKSTSFPTALTGMTQYYSGTFSIPTTSTAASINFPCTPAFNYGGDAIYVAWAYDEVTPSTNTNTYAATYAANVTSASLCATIYSSTTPAPTSMTLGVFRPCFSFSAVNTATNEVELVDFSTVPLGQLARVDNSQTVSVIVRNNSVNSVNNVPVGLGVTGANTFVDTKTVSTIAAGGTAQVVFTSFPSANTGTQAITAALAADQNTLNNVIGWTQSVTCAEAAIPPAYTASVFGSDALGSGSGRIFSFKYRPSTTVSLTAVMAMVPSLTNVVSSNPNANQQVFPVVLNGSTGAIVVAGPTVTMSSGFPFDTYNQFPFTAGNYPSLTANTDYYIGLGMVTGSFYPVGIYDPGYFVNGFYSSPNTGATAPVLVNYGYLGLGGMLTDSTMIISASATRTSMCVGETNSLKVSGAPGVTYTYQWNSPITGTAATSASVVVSPTLSANQSSTNVTYIVSGTNAGCKTNNASAVVKVSKCTGITEMNNAALVIYPNPSVNGHAQIAGLDGTNAISVYNSVGQVVLNLNSTSESVDLDLSNHAVGNYLVKITNSTGETKLMKLANQR